MACKPELRFRWWATVVVCAFYAALLAGSVCGYSQGAQDAKAKVDSILSNLQNPQQWTPETAEQQLITMGPAVIPHLLTHISDAPDIQWDVVRSVLVGFGPQSVEPLLEVVQDSTRELLARQRAAQALVEIGDPRIFQPFVALLADNDVRLRELAVKGLMAADAEAAVESLGNALEDPDPAVRQAAGTGLARIGTPEALSKLVEALHHPEARVRSSAAGALAGLGRKAVDLLLPVTNDVDFKARYWAISTLGRIGDRRATGRLIELLRSEDWGDRGLAAQALGAIGTKTAIEPLEKQLQVETYSWVRHRIQDALAAIRGDTGV